MIKNFLKIALRNINRNKVSSFINIAGLAIGIVCVIFIALYVQDELGYDRNFKDAERIYQVNLEGNLGGQEFLSGTTPPPVGSTLTATFPEIETFTRIFTPGDQVVRFGEDAERNFTEKQVLGVDSNFLQVFNYNLLSGDANKCLLQPDALVISSSIAKKYFGSENAIGRTLLFGDERTPFTVSGVFEDIRRQSTLRFDMLRPMASFSSVKRFSWSWVWAQMITYVKLKENIPNNKIALQKLESQFPAMIKQHAANAFIRIGQPLDELEKNGGKYILHLQPLTSVHLYSAGIGTTLTTLSDIKYIYIFSIIACFIIVLACVNFMNLSTAQSSKRAKEVGIRKVLGSEKKQLIKQFFIEAFLFTLMAGVLAVLSFILLIAPFNQLAGKELSVDLLFTGYNFIFLLALIVITALLSGSYPAFYLTSFSPAFVLKGTLMKTSFGSLFLRNGLVIFQFTISTVLIICTLIVFQQLQYTREKNLGLNKENVIVIANANRLNNSLETFQEEVEKLPGVTATSVSTSIPTKSLFTDLYVPVKKDGEQTTKDLFLSSFIVDYDFVSTLKLNLLKGRNFSINHADSTSVIVNEETVRQIGWKEPIGQYMEYPGGNNQKFKVIAVVENFNVQSLHNPMTPFALFHTSSKSYDIGSAYILARIAPGKSSEVLNKLESKWKSFVPATPFDYSFLDQEFNALYISDKRMGDVFSLFTALSLFVACLGLFGLATFTAERRTKEIGIRKVLGASVNGVVILLSKEFLKLVCIAAILAFPIAWWAMNKWLQDFAYRVNINWQVFIWAALSVMIIAVATVSFKAIRVAIANPVKSLRTE